MPKDLSINSVLVIGAGPIVIGQSCEFDYAGTQAILALKEENCRVILVNSNPATIMTDPEFADATYIEPLTLEFLTKIIEQERPDAILATMGGQTALNCALELSEQGVLERFDVSLIGVSIDTIEKAENREKFKKIVNSLGLNTPLSETVFTIKEALKCAQSFGFPIMIRASFALGGSGSGIAHTIDDLLILCNRAFEVNHNNGILLEKSIMGWKEYELEVMCDGVGNCIIICSIENFDPVGVHTGDSITIAPAQTLTDKEYQFMRNAAFSLMRELGMKTGGCNVQFALNPENGDIVVIEVNPRVSRSSALASKATGFPIAKIASKLALGYTLDELKNDLTQGLTPASFEPTLDYVVTKIPRFNFEKFPNADTTLSTQMKSVGEVIAIGRSFQESIQKALRSLETGITGFNPILPLNTTKNELIPKIQKPTPDRLLYIADAFRAGFNIEDIYKHTYIDRWFLSQVEDIIFTEKELMQKEISSLSQQDLLFLKDKGFSDARLAELLGTNESTLKNYREKYQIYPAFKRIDSCSGEFPTTTGYFYASYEKQCEVPTTNKEKILIIGSGPNRIGQGIEFDYSCVHASLSLQELGYETIMVNCNPSTVSTDYNISTRLYLEPLTTENILEIIKVEKPKAVIVQLGGQTPLHLARSLEEAGVTLLGTSSNQIQLAEDRQRFKQLLEKLKLPQPFNETFVTADQARSLATEIGYPLVLRPSYVIGGSGIIIIKDAESLEGYLNDYSLNGYPVLIEEFLDNAIEMEVDAVTDGNNILIGGIMQQLELTGIHSGDSSCVMPPINLQESLENEIYECTHKVSKALKIRGFINIQFAIKDDQLYIIEVNPRASRTIPYVAKSTNIPLVKLAVNCMLGYILPQSDYETWKKSSLHTAKIPVFPFNKFPGTKDEKGPEMKSTGEVMGIGLSTQEAFAKAKAAASKSENNIDSKHDKPRMTYLLQDKPICYNIYSLQKLNSRGALKKMEN
ncbi:MAG: carbamoyl-phosphate synthase large subunit [Alphaproteobacteria bacterium]|nr:carbamoyl-phosphate synthase large subunit [Alphaproteobacteria bacterium]